MADNIVDSLKTALQDVIAPDVRQLKVQLAALEQRMDDRLTALEQRMDDRFTSESAKVLAAIAELKANNELIAVREVASLRERVAVLETQLKFSSHTM